MSNPAYPWPYLVLVGAYGWLGRAAEASAALAEFQKRFPGGLTVQKYLSVSFLPPQMVVAIHNATANNATAKSAHERFAEGLRKAGMPEGEPSDAVAK